MLRELTGTFAGFWQYGTTTWPMLYTWLGYLFVARTTWVLHVYDENATGFQGAVCARSDENVVPVGTYIIACDGASLDLSMRHVF